MHDNVFPIFPGMEYGVSEPQETAAEAQERITAHLVDVLTEESDLVATLGGIVRRQDIERALGIEIVGEEFEFITAMLSGYISHFMTPLLPLLIRAGHEQYSSKQ